MICDKSSSYI